MMILGGSSSYDIRRPKLARFLQDHFVGLRNCHVVFPCLPGVVIWSSDETPALAKRNH